MRLFIINTCAFSSFKHIHAALPLQFGIGRDQLPLPKHREVFTFVVSLYPLLQSKLAWELKLYPGLENEKFPYAGRESTRGGQLRSVHSHAEDKNVH